MNLKSLKAFCLIMRHGSLAAAADSMHLSQPAVSRLISTLEHTMRITLFHRDKRALRPTAEGRAFHREAERILDGVERLPEIARDISEGAGAPLRVVVLSRLAAGLVAPAAKVFNERRPDVALTLEMHHRRDMERWLSGRQFDLGFAPLPVADSRISVSRLGARDAVAVFRAGHPLARSGTVAVPDLAAEPLIALTADTLLQSQIEAIFSAAGLTPRVAMRTSSTLLACALAAQGLGYTITDPFTVRGLPDTVTRARIEPGFAMEFGVLAPRDQAASPAAQDFEACVRSAFASLD